MDAWIRKNRRIDEDGNWEQPDLRRRSYVEQHVNMRGTIRTDQYHRDAQKGDWIRGDPG